MEYCQSSKKSNFSYKPLHKSIDFLGVVIFFLVFNLDCSKIYKKRNQCSTFIESFLHNKSQAWHWCEICLLFNMFISFGLFINNRDFLLLLNKLNLLQPLYFQRRLFLHLKLFEYWSCKNEESRATRVIYGMIAHRVEYSNTMVWFVVVTKTKQYPLQ